MQHYAKMYSSNMNPRYSHSIGIYSKIMNSNYISLNEFQEVRYVSFIYTNSATWQALDGLLGKGNFNEISAKKLQVTVIKSLVTLLK